VAKHCDDELWDYSTLNTINGKERGSTCLALEIYSYAGPFKYAE
jgi:hypothetical protein